MFWSVRPSAQPDASSSPSEATADISFSWAGVSRPVACASRNSIATVKWCMVVATPREGESEAIARCTRTASSGPAAAPP